MHPTRKGSKRSTRARALKRSLHEDPLRNLRRRVQPPSHSNCCARCRRITRQADFQQNASPEQRTLYQRMAQGNSLFEQLDDGSFRDISQAADVAMGRWAWSSVFADLNNDGWEDLIVGNGYITTDDVGDL